MDRYTKGVLTVIAVSLAVIALRGVVPQASADYGALNGPVHIVIDHVRQNAFSYVQSPLPVSNSGN